MSYLVLDIGNVIVNQDLEPFMKAISIQMNISRNDAFNFISQIQVKQDLGITSFRDAIVERFNIKSEYILDNLAAAWNEVISPNYPSIQFMEKLMDHGVEIALLSNIGLEHHNWLNNTIKHTKLYSKSVHHFSYQIGARKPTQLYYNLFLQQYPDFAGAIYLDDLKENLEAGNRAGFFAYHWDLSQKTTWEPGDAQIKKEKTNFIKKQFLLDI